MRLVIAMPARNDWEAAFQVCAGIDRVLRQTPDIHGSILLIDDGSTSLLPAEKLPKDLRALERLSVLELRRNLGHQRAIAVAIAHLHQSRQADALIVMDADGEDRPEDILNLIKAAQNSRGATAVFAERGKRLETLIFRSLYQTYRILHHILVGRDIRFGNFSYLPWPFLDTLVVFPELWNHYAAALLKSGLPYIRVRVDRAKRLAGRSQMNFVNLVVHGLSGLFANQEVAGTRALIMGLLGSLVFFLGFASLAVIRRFGGMPLPSWSLLTAGALLVIGAQAFIAALVVVFLITMNRSQLGFLPIRDYAYFVRQEVTLFGERTSPVAVGSDTAPVS